MAIRCGINKPCHGMKGGLLGPFFQNGADLSGYGLGSSSGGVTPIPSGITVDTTLYTIDSTLITADNG